MVVLTMIKQEQYPEMNQDEYMQKLRAEMLAKLASYDQKRPPFDEYTNRYYEAAPQYMQRGW